MQHLKVASLVILICLAWYCSGLKIASFNIQVLGTSKMKKPDVVEKLIEILQRYDLTAVQEIRSKDGRAFKTLVKKLNKKGPIKYDFVISPREGRSHSKEQYGIVYNPQKVRISSTFQFEDVNDKFERSPFAVMVKTFEKKVPAFILVVNHLDPDDVFNEMEALYEAANQIKEKWAYENMIITGDLNADCGYLSGAKRKRIKFTNDPDYVFLIKDDVDTTVGKTDCAYDRFIVHGELIKGAVVKESVKAFDFEEYFQLSSAEAKRISDHKPIEMELN